MSDEGKVVFMELDQILQYASFLELANRSPTKRDSPKRKTDKMIVLKNQTVVKTFNDIPFDEPQIFITS